MSIVIVYIEGARGENVIESEKIVRKRIIINNDAKIDDVLALNYVIAVIKQGKISVAGDGTKKYCHITAFKRVRKPDLIVSATLTRKHKNTVFYIYESNRTEN